jgi:ribonucleoside-diphosphate reductase alpha chain
MILDTSGGVEPQFSLVYVKNVMDGEKLLYVNKHLEQELKNLGIYSQDLMERISEHGSLQNIDEIPEETKKVFVVSHDIKPEWHIRMQAAFQKYTDNAVSKTINFSREATREDIRTAYELSYELGCKGVTVYRDGSRENQVLNVGKTIKDKDGAVEVLHEPRKRPEVTQGITQRMHTGCGHLYVTVNSDEHGACELFTQMGKVGGCASAQLEGIARLVSISLRSNIDIDSIIKHLKGIRCPSPMWNKGKLVTSCSDAVAQALENFKIIYGNKTIKDFKVDATDDGKEPVVVSMGMMKTCPECGSSIEHSEGCLKCNSCGWSKC